MYSVEKLLEMITSERTSTRYEACEWLRIAQQSSPEIIYSLRKATFDDDKEVATRAYMALQADVHQKMMVSMGLIKTVEKEIAAEKIDEPQTGEVQEAESQPEDNQTELTGPGAIPAIDPYFQMLKSIRSWGVWSIIWGILSLIANNIFSAPWGLYLIFVGLASFIFKSPSMFVIYAVTMAYAAITNLSSLDIKWVLSALFQLYLTVRIIMDYRKYRGINEPSASVMPASPTESPHVSRAGRTFPWIGSCLGCSSLPGLIFIFILGLFIAMASEATVELPGYIYFIAGMLVNIGVLGFAVGLASVLSGYRPKVVAILGMVGGALTILLQIFLTLSIQFGWL